MKIKLFACIGVIIMLLGCTAHREVVGVREVESKRVTEIQGVGVVHGTTLMSEGMSIVEIEVHYSLPDSTGKQSRTKEIRRVIETKKEEERTIDEELKVIEEVTDTVSVMEVCEVEDDKGRGGTSGGVLIFLIFMLVLLWLYNRG